jgi:hypothetical protein
MPYSLQKLTTQEENMGFKKIDQKMGFKVPRKSLPA